MARGMEKERVLPEGWRKVKLGEIAKIYSGGTPSRGNPEYWGGKIPWVKTTQIKNGIIDLVNIDEYISEKGLKNSSAKIVPKGTILMAMYGQGKTRGKVSILGIDAATNQACATIQIQESECRNFIFQQLRFRYQAIRNISNDGSQKNLSIGLIGQLAIPIPPLPEQKAIASLLETWDTATEKTEVLIAAKEKRFKWLLKTLISDQQDNPEWLKMRLDEICKIQKGTQLNKLKMIADGEYPALNGGISPSGYTDKWNTLENTVTISEGGNSCGYINFMTEKFWSGGHCYALLELSKKLNVLFLYYQLKQQEKEIMKLRVGSGLPNIQKGDIAKFPLSLPSFSQQLNIVNRLNKAQYEINLFKRLSQQYQTQKRGLMQKLLTGKWAIENQLTENIP